MKVVDSPPENDLRSVSIVAEPSAMAALRAAISDDPSLRLVASVHRFAELVVSREFPGDVVVLAEPAGAPLLAHARTAASAGALVVVHADLPADLLEKLDEAGVAVVSASDPAAAVAECVASMRRPRARSRSASDPGAERPRLSHSERRALALYSLGHTTVQVAAEMGIGYETAKTFLRRVRAKYTAVDRPTSKRSELVQRAEEDGIL